MAPLAEQLLVILIPGLSLDTTKEAFAIPYALGQQELVIASRLIQRLQMLTASVYFVLMILALPITLLLDSDFVK